MSGSMSHFPGQEGSRNITISGILRALPRATGVLLLIPTSRNNIADARMSQKHSVIVPRTSPCPLLSFEWMDCRYGNGFNLLCQILLAICISLICTYNILWQVDHRDDVERSNRREG
jgi:hypothetical protein